MRRSFLAVPVLLIGACSSQSRLAPVVAMPEQPTAADFTGSVVVPYPPPPAQVEVVPPPPTDPNCVWVDGQWAYKDQEYGWVPGAWVQRPAGCSFARSRFFWDEAGYVQLRYRSGRWVIPAPPFAECPAPPPCH